MYHPVNLALSALAAHLVSVQTIALRSPVSIKQGSIFVSAGLTARDSLESVLDIVSSTLVYDGQLSGWTTFQNSFQPCERPDSLSKAGTVGNLTIATTAYCSSLSCKILKSNVYNLDYSPGIGQLIITAPGDGCPLEAFLTYQPPGIEAPYMQYLQTYANIQCPIAGSGRIFVFAAEHDEDAPDLLRRKTLLSCRSYYHQLAGTIVVSYPSATSKPLVENFINRSRTLMHVRPAYWNLFEQELQQSTVLDPTATLSRTNFAQVIMSRS